MSGITIDKSKATTPLPSCDVYSHLAPKNARNLNKKNVEVAQVLCIQAQYSIMQ